MTYRNSKQVFRRFVSFAAAMDNKGLLFIPDISGFTRFVNETEIGHSRMIIQELLEGLINSNQMNLEISEIEGDAILFYKFGEPPTLDVIYRQVETMFRNFHQSLNAYDVRKYCYCQACISAADLTLKIITHFGEYTGYHVKQFSKLIGKDVIVVHQLLKNDIENHEYWLVTLDLPGANPPSGLADWMKWNRGARKTENGEVVYHYTPLSRLREEIVPEHLPPADLDKSEKKISLTREYATDIVTLFHATGDFTHRSKWREGVSRVEEISHQLPRVGMKCRFVMASGEIITCLSSYYAHQSDKIEFREAEVETNRSFHYTLEQLGDHKTRLTIDVYFPRMSGAELQSQEDEIARLRGELERSMDALAGTFTFQEP